MTDFCGFGTIFGQKYTDDDDDDDDDEIAYFTTNPLGLAVTT